MLEIYTIYGGGMWKTALDAVVTLIGTNTFSTLMRMVGTFAVLAVLLTFIKQRNPMVFVQWLAIFMLINTILLAPKRSVQVIDISDPAAVWKTDNVPVGLAAIASLTTSVGFKMSSVYDTLMARPDSITYSKTGMLFGSQIVAETSDFTTQNPELAQMLPDYVENCVIGDILLNQKYTVNQLLNSSDPLGLITSSPSPLRGIFHTTPFSREFMTCRDAALQISALANMEANPGSATFSMLVRKIFGTKVNGTTLLANAMGESYGYFYAGGMSAAQIMKNNITNSAVRQGIKGFAARSSDTANLLNLASENAATKQRLSWASGNVLATRTLPFAQSLLMLILVCLFPLMIALAAANHSLFGLNTLKLYAGGFIYFQMWPVMFAILNYAANFWLQTKTGGTALVLANKDVVALQHSDVANLAGYLALSIPILAFYLTKGASAIGSQVAGSVLSSAAFGSAGVAATASDGNWSFNNMSMDNVSQNKMDTNLMQRQGQQTWQADNGSTQTMTSGGHTVIDGSGAMSNLPVNMKLSQLASSGFQESARQSDVQAKTALDGYNHSVTSGWSQLSQLSSQTGTSDSLTRGSENSQTTNATRGASMMMSAAENYAKANNISTQEAYNQLMSKSVEGSVNAGASVKFNTGDQALGKIGKWATGVTLEGHGGAEVKGASGSSHGTQETHSDTQDMRHDRNSQAVNDFRQGMEMVTSSRVTDGSNHSENAATSNVQQFASTLNDAQSQYHQYTTSSTQSNEYSRMATLAQNQSASLDTNYTQEFVDWAAGKYGDKAQGMLTSAPSAREAAMEFVNERLKPEIMGDYQQGRSDLSSGAGHAAFSGEHIVRQDAGRDNSPGNSSQGQQPVSAGTYQAGSLPAGSTRSGGEVAEYPVTGQQTSSGTSQSGSGMEPYQASMTGHNGGGMQTGTRNGSGNQYGHSEQLHEQRPENARYVENPQGSGRQSLYSERAGISPGQRGSDSLSVQDEPQGMAGNTLPGASRFSPDSPQYRTGQDNTQQGQSGYPGTGDGRSNMYPNGQQTTSYERTDMPSGQRTSSGLNAGTSSQEMVPGLPGNGMHGAARNTHESQQTQPGSFDTQQRQAAGQGTENGRDHADQGGTQPLTEIHSGQRSSGLNVGSSPQDAVPGQSGSGMLTTNRNTHESQQNPSESYSGQQYPAGHHKADSSRGDTELNGRQTIVPGNTGQRESSGLSVDNAVQDTVHGPSGTGMQTATRNTADNQLHTPTQQTGQGNAETNGKLITSDGHPGTSSAQLVPGTGNTLHQAEGTANTLSGHGQTRHVAGRGDNAGHSREGVETHQVVSRETSTVQPDGSVQSMMHESHDAARDQHPAGKHGVNSEETGGQQQTVAQHNGQQAQPGVTGQTAGREDSHLHHSELVTGQQEKVEPASRHTTEPVKMNLPDGRINAEGMQKSLAENQAKLAERSGFSFEPQNEIQRRVAEQRSANEQNINESAGEIGKNRSTVQASSDIFKDEMENIKSQFHEGKKIEELKQKAMPFLERDEIDMHKENLEELRKRWG